MNHLSRVTVCRGCCCGTAKKHPGVDHEAQLRTLRENIEHVQVADCLDSCTHSNVVVVRPSPAARSTGARPVWLGGVLTDEATRDIATWIAEGGPGRVDLPARLVSHVIDRPAEAD